MGSSTGFRIGSVAPDGMAARARLKAGDVIFAIEGVPVTTLQQVEAESGITLRNMRQRSLTFEILRGGVKEFVSVGRGDLGILGDDRTPEQVEAELHARYKDFASASSLGELFKGELFKEVKCNLVEPMKFESCMIVGWAADHVVLAREDVVHVVPFSSLLTATKGPGGSWTLLIRHQVIYKGSMGVGVGLAIPLS